jgi:hypothetical protein
MRLSWMATLHGETISAAQLELMQEAAVANKAIKQCLAPPSQAKPAQAKPESSGADPSRTPASAPRKWRPADLPSHLIKSRGRARVMEEEAQRERSGGSVQSKISEYDEDSGISGFDR